VARGHGGLGQSDWPVGLDRAAVRPPASQVRGQGAGPGFGKAGARNCTRPASPVLFSRWPWGRRCLPRQHSTSIQPRRQATAPGWGQSGSKAHTPSMGRAPRLERPWTCCEAFGLHRPGLGLCIFHRSAVQAGATASTDLHGVGNRALQLALVAMAIGSDATGKPPTGCHGFLEFHRFNPRS
jgi:hypothetical protein